ncbi:MAG: redoxin domain-containing protein, partial [Pseudomonadota bacterium]
MSSVLAAGTAAPDFTLRVTPDQNLTLSNLRGRPVILAFYPADWSPVCGDQVTLYNEILPEFHKHKAELLGISVDGAWCHAAFARDRRLHFPLLADFEPKGDCPSADNLRLLRRFAKRGSGSSGLEFKRPAADAASVGLRWLLA